MDIFVAYAIWLQRHVTMQTMWAASLYANKYHKAMAWALAEILTI